MQECSSLLAPGALSPKSLVMLFRKRQCWVTGEGCVNSTCIDWVRSALWVEVVEHSLFHCETDLIFCAGDPPLNSLDLSHTFPCPPSHRVEVRDLSGDTKSVLFYPDPGLIGAFRFTDLRAGCTICIRYAQRCFFSDLATEAIKVCGSMFIN